MSKKDFKIQESITGVKKSKLKRYQELVIGTEKLPDLIKYELIILLFSRLPGAIGIILRGKFFPKMLGKTGRGVVFGNNIVIRHPKKIFLGDNVIIDDNVLLDAKGSENSGITLKNDVFVGRNSILSCKGGEIILEERANVGFNCEIFSSNRVVIGKDNLIAAYTYVVGGGNYKLERTDIPINQQPDFDGKGGVITEEDVWLAAHVVLLDGTKVGKGSVIAAGAIVSGEIPQYSIAGGVPAKVLRNRIKE
jgi:acetyltransferase-like isoleucine patch superfamily enzyme